MSNLASLAAFLGSGGLQVLQVSPPSSGQLPGLLVALPIVAATLPLALGLVRDRIGWAVAAVALAVEAAVATALAWAVYADGTRVVHVLGGDSFGRQPENEGFIVGIELVGDALSGAVVFAVAVASLAVLAFTRSAGPRSNAFYSGYLLLTGGLMGAALTGDLFNLFVFLEISGLATYALIASDRSAESAVASLKYLIVGTVGASMYLVGVGYLFVSTGTLNMVDVSNSLAGEPSWIDGALYGDPLVAASFAFVAAGLLTKAAIFPLHTWQPDAYQRAPDGVTIYVSALVSTVAAYAFARITWNVFTPAFFEETPLAIEAVLAIAAISVLAGSALAAAQPVVKRMFAYSSVAQFGLIVIAIGVAVHPDGGETATRFAVYGAVVHLLGHALMKGGLFATAGAIAQRTGARTVREYAGMAKRAPGLSAAIAALGVAIVGVPPTLGFVGKWYMAVGAVESGLWWIVPVVFASTLLTLVYVARILEAAYFDYRPEDAPEHAEPSAGLATDGGPGSGGATGESGPASPSDWFASPLGPRALAICAAVFAIVLGLVAADLTAAIDPVAEAVIDGAPEVTAGE